MQPLPGQRRRQGGRGDYDEERQPAAGGVDADPLALLWLGRFLWRRYWTVAIHVDSNGEITDIEPIGRGAATLYKREGIERLESFANSELPPSDPKVQA